LVFFGKNTLSGLTACYTLRPFKQLQLSKPGRDDSWTSKPAPQNIQDGFLNLARREKTTVTNLSRQRREAVGRIKSFDKFSLILESGAQEQLIFKHAISTISQAGARPASLRGQQQPSENPGGTN